MENVYDCYYDYKLDKFVLKDNQYGKWGVLNSEQRQLIERLLNEMDNADAVIKKQYEEKQQLISWLEDKIKETTPNIKTNYYDEDGFKKAQDINNSNIIMKPVHIVYQEVLEFVRGGKK